jgi:hypothetical protein
VGLSSPTVQRGRYFWLHLHSSRKWLLTSIGCRFASHFNSDLLADRLLNCSSYLTVIAASGLLYSLTFAAVAVAALMVHADFVGRSALWLGCYLLAYLYAIHRLVVRANRTDPPRIAMAPFVAVIATVPIALAMFVAAIVSQIP